MDRLFVYGTLRDGQSARSLVAANMRHWEAATATGLLYALPGGYPGMVDGPGVVCGEVVWLTNVVAALQGLDAYENDEFTCIVRRVTLKSGRRLTAWVYVLADPVSAKRGSRIDSGDWGRYLASADESI